MSFTLQLLTKQYIEISAISQKLINIKNQVDSTWKIDVSKLNKLQKETEECNEKVKKIQERLYEVLEEAASKHSEIFRDICKFSGEINGNADSILDIIKDKNIFANLSDAMESLKYNTAMMTSYILREVSIKLGPTIQSFIGQLPYSLQKFLPSK